MCLLYKKSKLQKMVYSDKYFKNEREKQLKNLENIKTWNHNMQKWKTKKKKDLTINYGHFKDVTKKRLERARTNSNENIKLAPLFFWAPSFYGSRWILDKLYMVIITYDLCGCPYSVYTCMRTGLRKNN